MSARCLRDAWQSSSIIIIIIIVLLALCGFFFRLLRRCYWFSNQYHRRHRDRDLLGGRGVLDVLVVGVGGALLEVLDELSQVLPVLQREGIGDCTEIGDCTSKQLVLSKQLVPTQKQTTTYRPAAVDSMRKFHRPSRMAMNFHSMKATQAALVCRPAGRSGQVCRNKAKQYLLHNVIPPFSHVQPSWGRPMGWLIVHGVSRTQRGWWGWWWG